MALGVACMRALGSLLDVRTRHRGERAARSGRGPALSGLRRRPRPRTGNATNGRDALGERNMSTGIVCSYCTNYAKGRDEDGEATCGFDLCAEIVAPLEKVTEVSNEGDEEWNPLAVFRS